jgi:hypothetical protein
MFEPASSLQAQQVLVTGIGIHDGGRGRKTALNKNDQARQGRCDERQ